MLRVRHLLDSVTSPWELSDAIEKQRVVKNSCGHFAATAEGAANSEGLPCQQAAPWREPTAVHRVKRERRETPSAVLGCLGPKSNCPPARKTERFIVGVKG